MDSREAAELRNELRELRRDFARLERRTRVLEDGLTAVISREDLRQALVRQTNELERRRDEGRSRAFGRREKLTALAIAGAVLGLSILRAFGVVA